MSVHFTVTYTKHEEEGEENTHVPSNTQKFLSSHPLRTNKALNQTKLNLTNQSSFIYASRVCFFPPNDSPV